MDYQKDLVVDGISYSVSSFPAGKSLKVLTKLVKLIGEPVANLSGAMDSDVSVILPRAIAALTEKMDDDGVLLLVKEILGGVSTNVDGKILPVVPIFDTHFQKRIGHLFKLLGEVLGYQYGDFLEVLVASVAQAAAVKASRSQSTLSGDGQS